MTYFDHNSVPTSPIPDLDPFRPKFQLCWKAVLQEHADHPQQACRLGRHLLRCSLETNILAKFAGCWRSWMHYIGKDRPPFFGGVLRLRSCLQRKPEASFKNCWLPLHPVFFVKTVSPDSKSKVFIQAKSRPDDLTLVARASALQNILPCSLWFASVLRASEWEMSPEICFSYAVPGVWSKEGGCFTSYIFSISIMVIIVTPCPSGRVHQSWWTWNTGIGCDDPPHRNVQPSEVQLSRCGYGAGLCMFVFTVVSIHIVAI